MLLDAGLGCLYTFLVWIPGGLVSSAPKKKSVCMLCGKPSPKTICGPCSDRVNSEALHKKKKEHKGTH